MKTLFQLLGSPNQLIDSHCHLNDPQYDEVRDSLVDQASDAGVEQIYDVAVNVESSNRALKNALKYPQVKAFIGIDPEVCIPGSHLYEADIESKIEEYHTDLNMLIVDNRQLVTGIGETGLDHYWTKVLDAEVREKSHQNQERLYRMHLELAQKHELPLTIHSRGAEARCLEVLKEYSVVGIFHSYTGDYETAIKILESGCGLGVNGIVTFKNAQDLRDMYKKLWITSSDNFTYTPTISELYTHGFYFETDSPFLSPEGKRGERNVPANAHIVYEQFIKVAGGRL